LLFLFLKSLTQKKRFSWWISFIFLIHPLQTEAVAYINSRGDSLYALLTFFGLWLWTRLLRKQRLKLSVDGINFALPNWLMLSLATSSFVLSVLAKETALASLALWLLASSYIYLKQPKLRKRTVKLSLTVISFLSFLTIGYLKLRFGLLHWGSSNDILQAYPSVYSHLGVRLLTFSKIIFIYLQLIILPFPLHMERNVTLVTNFFSFFPILFVISNITLVYFALKEWYINKSIFIIAGWWWFLSMLVPVSGIIPTNGLIYEHWLYLPLVGCFMMFYGLFKLILTTTRRYQLVINEVTALTLTLIVPIYLAISFYQIRLWVNPIKFYQHTLKYAQTARVWNNLGMEYANRGQDRQALSAYKQALKINPDYAQIQHNIGQIYLKHRQWHQAIKHYQQAINLNKHFLFSYPPLIMALQQSGKETQAHQVLKQFEQLNRNDKPPTD